MFILSNLSFTSIAILSAVFAAICNVLARTLLKSLRSQDLIGITMLTMVAVMVLVSPLFYHFQANFTNVCLIILIAFIDTLANYFFFKTFEKTEASIATPILSLAPVFTFFFSWLLLNDTVSFLTYFEAILILLLIITFSIDFKNFQKFKIETLVPGLTSCLLFGLSAIPSKYLLNKPDVINAPTLYMFRGGFIALFSLLIFGFAIQHITIKQYRIIFVRSLFVILQWILLYEALTLGNAGVTLTLGNITPIFVFFLSILFLKEKPNLKKILTAILVLLLSLVI